jgi:hypothetical protein
MVDFLSMLPKILRGVGDSDQAREQAVFAAWAAVVGDHLRRATAPIKLEKKTLLVAVSDATWRNQLRHFSAQALFKLNSLLKGPVVTQIEFVVNPRFVEESHPVTREVRFVAPEMQALPLMDKANSIPDEEMRALFLRVAGKCLERRAR